MKNHEPPSEQTILPFNSLCDRINQQIRRRCPSASPKCLLHTAACGRYESAVDHSADLTNKKLSGLRDFGRADGDMDVVTVNGPFAAGPDPTDPTDT
jgi:hypothetical protein